MKWLFIYKMIKQSKIPEETIKENVRIENATSFIYDPKYQKNLGRRTGLFFGDVDPNKNYDGYSRYSDYLSYGQPTYPSPRQFSKIQPLKSQIQKTFEQDTNERIQQDKNQPSKQKLKNQNIVHLSISFSPSTPFPISQIKIVETNHSSQIKQYQYILKQLKQQTLNQEQLIKFGQLKKSNTKTDCLPNIKSILKNYKRQSIKNIGNSGINQQIINRIDGQQRNDNVVRRKSVKFSRVINIHTHSLLEELQKQSNSSIFRIPSTNFIKIPQQSNFQYQQQQNVYISPVKRKRQIQQITTKKQKQSLSKRLSNVQDQFYNRKDNLKEIQNNSVKSMKKLKQKEKDQSKLNVIDLSKYSKTNRAKVKQIQKNEQLIFLNYLRYISTTFSTAIKIKIIEKTEQLIKGVITLRPSEIITFNGIQKQFKEVVIQNNAPFKRRKIIYEDGIKQKNLSQQIRVLPYQDFRLKNNYLKALSLLLTLVKNNDI